MDPGIAWMVKPNPRALALAWVTLFLVVGLALVLAAPNQIDKDVGEGLLFAGLLAFAVTLYIFRSPSKSATPEPTNTRQAGTSRTLVESALGSKFMFCLLLCLAIIFLIAIEFEKSVNGSINIGGGGEIRVITGVSMVVVLLFYSAITLLHRFYTNESEDEESS